MEPFSPQKLHRGVEAALADRPVPANALAELLDDVEAAATAHGGPMSSEAIGRLVLDGLRVLDEVAYLRFASVYKDFQGADDFGREVAALEVQSARESGEVGKDPAPLGAGSFKDS